jgi:hypothetical protein
MIEIQVTFLSGRGTSRPREVATAMVGGQEYRAESRASCEAALARVLVGAGMPDQPWQTRTRTGTVSLRGRGLHWLAGHTIEESDKGGLKRVKFRPYDRARITQDGVEVEAETTEAA